MKTTTPKVLFALFSGAALCMTIVSSPATAEDAHSHHHEDADHSEVHNEVEEEKHRKQDSVHSEEEHGKAEHQEHDPEVALSAKAIRLAGVTIERVKSAEISKTVQLAGEVDFDNERVVHVAPRFPGVVTATTKGIGDSVKTGEALASIESNESLTDYKVKARMSGTVIEKHIALGEFVSEENTLYIIADLSHVWVNLEVYAKDAEHVRVGQTVAIESIGSALKTKGTISYIKPVYNKQTRSLIARVILENPEQRWRPGTFVRGLVTIDTHGAVPVVSKNAVQIVNESTCIFVPEAHEENVFKAIPVKLGENDKEHVHIISGLSLNDEYVAKGAYELKAELLTGSLSGHAGHGH